VNWHEFESACPELAGIARERLSGDELGPAFGPAKKFAE
jgi:hypothetical protein